ncbi:unnamed protein product [Amaranthus hypochondriacus]
MVCITYLALFMKFTSLSSDCTALVQQAMPPVDERVDESLRVEDVEIYYDPAELFGGLLQGQEANSLAHHDTSLASGCPLGH